MAPRRRIRPCGNAHEKSQFDGYATNRSSYAFVSRFWEVHLFTALDHDTSFLLLGSLVG